MNPLDRTKVNPQPHLRGTAGSPDCTAFTNFGAPQPQIIEINYRNQPNKVNKIRPILILRCQDGVFVCYHKSLLNGAHIQTGDDDRALPPEHGTMY
jgi:hypothetical protein